jgi:ADP-ribosylglycohydrolase
LRYPNDYKTTVIRGANTNGDSNSIACIAGTISGAYLGIDAIPGDWIDRIEKSGYLADILSRLSALRE